MVRRHDLTLFFLPLALVLTWAPAAQSQTVVTEDEWCQEGGGNPGSERYCEVREYTVEARNRLRVDAEPNGGIRVEAWDRNEISLRARVQAWSRRGDPREIVENIRIETGNTIAADGPDTRGREGWSVSYRLMVPRNVDLELESVNGGLHVSGVHGTMQLETLNGGIQLDDVGGNVRGETTNGGLDVRLSGTQWEGEELSLRTTNGGVTLNLPGDFRADIEAGTVNGSLSTDFPITVRGRVRARRISTQLNGGGPLIRVSTTNGGVRIRER
jgi:hypothetical protein